MPFVSTVTPKDAARIYDKDNMKTQPSKKIKAAIERLNSFLVDDSGYDKEVYPLLHKRLEENESVSPNYEELEIKLHNAEHRLAELKAKCSPWLLFYLADCEEKIESFMARENPMMARIYSDKRDAVEALVKELKA